MIFYFYVLAALNSLMLNIKEKNTENSIKDVLRPAGAQLKMFQNKDKEQPNLAAMGNGSVAGLPKIA